MCIMVQQLPHTIFFRTNIQGDVLAIFDGNTKAQVVSFNYDAWGNYTTTVSNATLSQIALNYTHLRYRGYYQDSETGFYYLNSRYYDAKMCRFINSDGVISSANGDLQGYNMYAYCFNNPVNMSDQSGNWPVWLEFLIGVGSKSKIQQTKTSKYIKEKIIQPIAEDVENFDINNTDENKVLEANKFSAYRGVFVIKSELMGANAFSYGVIVMGNSEKIKENDVKHEYGHFVQLCFLGKDKYNRYIAIPSLKGYFRDDKYYYSQPWEYGADLFGGVTGRNYTEKAAEKFLTYWENIFN